jgi:hypothetical protein
MNYYYLVAGLPDLQADDTKGVASLTELKNQLLEELSNSDGALLQLLFASFDNQNFLALLQNQDAVLHSAGNPTIEDRDELVALLKEFENSADKRLLTNFHTFSEALKDEKSENEILSKENYKSARFYEYALKCENVFLRNWFEYNLNVNNLLAAIECRKHGFDPKSQIIGSNDVANTIQQSNARDFGLTGMFDDYELVIRISEETNLLEREKKIDALKWAWLDENTFFNYFGVEKILVFVLKIEMIERWKMLSVENGTKIFRELLSVLKEGVRFE